MKIEYTFSAAVSLTGDSFGGRGYNQKKRLNRKQQTKTVKGLKAVPKMSNYEQIIKNNLQHLYSNLPQDLADRLPASRIDNDYKFQAFGENCRISPQDIQLGDKAEFGPAGIVISLYALQASEVACQLAPFRAFREMPDSMPYVGAFASNTERLLVDHIDKIEQAANRITQQFNGSQGTHADAGDFSFTVYPLPKIALNYIFYCADDDFPAAVTCLYSYNASDFLPTDALADTGEYTSRKIIELI